jgi:hypothetical protein
MAATRARKAPAKTVEPEPETTVSGRSEGEMHDLFAAYLNENYGADITPRQIFLVTSKRNEFRRTDVYADYAERRDEERTEKPVKTKAAKKAEPKPDEEPKAKPVARRRGRTAPVVDTTDEAPKAKPVRRGRTSPPKAEETKAEVATPRRRSPARRSAGTAEVKVPF